MIKWGWDSETSSWNNK